MKNKKIPINSVLLSFKLSIGKLGIAGVEMYCNEAIVYLNSKILNISNMYLYYIFEGLDIEQFGRGTIGSHGNLNKDILTKLKIPIPKSKDKITEWVDKISKPYDEKNNKQNKIKELEEYVQNKIKDITDNEECDEVELGSVCKINDQTMKKNQYDYINYIDIASVKNEKINDLKYLTNKFPSRAKRLAYKNDILYSTVRPNLKGYMFMYSDIPNCVVSTGFAVITPKINPMYLYTLIKDDEINKILVEQANGSEYPAVDPSIFSKIKIKIPKDKKLIQDLEPTFQEIEKLNDELKEAEILYKQLIKELAEEAIPSTATLTEENIKNNTETDSKTPSVKSSVSSSSSVKELKEQCKSLGIKGYSKCKKAELIKLLEDHK